MVPFPAFGKTSWIYGSPRLERYNGVAAVQIQGQGAPGISSGEAMLEIEKLVQQLPDGFGIEWTAASYQEREAGGQTYLLYILPVHLQTVYRGRGYRAGDLPVTEAVANRLLCLPIYAELTEDQVTYVGQCLAEVL